MSLQLPDASRVFAAELSDLLNATVCNGVRMRSVVFPKYTLVGYQISPKNVRGEGIPLIIGKGSPDFYLGVSIRLEPNSEKDHLMVLSSAMVLALQSELDNSNVLLHYDYEREKADGYPDAHLQICASSENWEAAVQRSADRVRPLEKLHLPVGGKRYRPTLEDLIEFLVVEGLVAGRPNWAEAIEDSRQRFQEKQLRALIRRNPRVALDQLQKDGHLT